MDLNTSTWADDYEEVSAQDISAMQEQLDEEGNKKPKRERRLNKRNPHHRKQLDRIDSDEEIEVMLDPANQSSDFTKIPGEFKGVEYSSDEEVKEEKVKKKYKRKENEDGDDDREEFYDPKWEQKLEKYCKLEGKLRVKREIEALIGKIEWDYFQFCADGRIFVGWENKPKKITDKPKYAIFCRNLRKVVPTYKGKRGHFLLDSTYAKDLLMICMREAESQMWCEALNWFKLYWKSQPRKDYEGEESGFTIDPRVVVEIMIDLEKAEPQQMQEMLNYDDVLKMKKMDKQIKKCGNAMLENRFAHGYIKKMTGQQMDADVAGDEGGGEQNKETEQKDDTQNPLGGGLANALGAITFGNKIVVPKSGGFSKRKYGCIITAKDTDYEDDDDEIIDKKKLPPWMDLEVVYVFPYEEKDDGSAYEFKMSTKEMLSIAYQDDSASKEGYTFRVETRDKVIFYNVRTAHECKKWVEILCKSKKTIEEMGRTK